MQKRRLKFVGGIVLFFCFVCFFFLKLYSLELFLVDDFFSPPHEA